MARRKSLVEQMLAAQRERQRRVDAERARQAAALDRAERAQRQAEIQEQKRRDARDLAAYKANLARAEQEKKQRAAEAAKIERELARREQQRERDETREREAAARERKAAEAERARAEATAARAAKTAAIDALKAEAGQRTAEVESCIVTFADVLVDRERRLHHHRLPLEDEFASGGAEAMALAVADLLTRLGGPEQVQDAVRAAYAPETRELLLEIELPRQSVIPTESGFRYVASKSSVVAEPRKAAEIRQLFRDLAARFTLRAVDYALTVSPPALVGTVLVNGHVRAKDPATGKPVHPCLVSVKVSREVFEEIDLDEPALDPVACLKYLSAMLSPHPYDLEAVRPVLAFDLSRFKFVDELDVLSQLDHRQDLLQLTPTEFEHLVRQLFEAMGLKAWVTQASRDDGVDAFAFNPDPVLGGQCVIQAKRYSKVIPIEAVRALEGTIQDKRAAKGILVATSWFSSGDREFADRMGRIELIDGSNLKALLAEYLGRDVVIGLDRLPPGWLRSDIA